MRYAILLVLGLVIGIIGTVMTMGAMHRGPRLSENVMHLTAFHMDGLEKNIKENRCAVTDNVPHLQTMRALSNDLEPAFLPIDNEQDFRQKAGSFRAALDSLLASPPADCPSVGAAMTRLSHECKSCHDEFRPK